MAEKSTSNKKKVEFSKSDDKDQGDGKQDLASMIMSKLQTGDFVDGDKMEAFSDI